MDIFRKLPAPIRALLEGGIAFLLLSIFASLRLTSIASGVTLLAALVVGFGTAFYLNKKELLYSSLVTLIPNLILQWLYFSDAGQYMDFDAVIILLIGNVIVITVCALLGGAIALLIRKRNDRKQKEEEIKLKKRTDTRWIDRLFVVITLFFYLTMYVIPVVIPVHASADCSKKQLNSDEFIECFDPDKKYHPHAVSVVEPPKRRMPLEGAQQYYNQFPDIPKEVIDNILTQCGSTTNCDVSSAVTAYKNDMSTIQLHDSIGIPTWQQTYPEADGYTSALWRSTIGGVISLGNAFKQDFWSTTKAVGKGIVQFLDRGMIMTNPGYATQRFVQTFGKDMRSYYGKAAQKVVKGNIIQGVGDFLNVPKFLGSVIDNHYSGGTRQLVRDVQNPNKVMQWGVSAGAISQETATAIQNKNYRYAIGSGAGEVTGYVFWYVATEGAIAGVKKVSQAITNQVIIRQAVQSSVPNSKIGSVAKDISEFVGEGASYKRNGNDDLFIISKDGKRQVRFDINNPGMKGTTPDSPHMHLLEKKSNDNGWKDALKGTHRIYPNEQ